MTNLPFAVIPGRYFLDHTWLFPLLYFWTKLIFRLAFRGNHDIVHSRGYLASHVSAKLARRDGYKTVFDMRSLWPKEHVSIGAWRESDRIYRLWERVEFETVSESDVSVAQSSPMAADVEMIDPGSLVKEIPICVDTQLFRPVTEGRNEQRNELGWNENIVLGYHGSLGLNGSNIFEIAEFFERINRAVPETRLLILTSNRSADVTGVMSTAGVRSDRYAVQHPTQSQIPEIFSAVDIGVHAMSAGPDSHMRMSVKFVEYLSCGLPALVNQNVGAAAALIDEFNLGVVASLDSTNEQIAEAIQNIIADQQNYRARCRAFAEDEFAVSVSARRYLDLYAELLAYRDESEAVAP